MQKTFINTDYIYFPSIPSTNDYVLEKMKLGEIEFGTVVIADFQSSGKGQRGKPWYSESGESLMMSIAADLNLWEIKSVVSLNHIVSLAIQNFLMMAVQNIRIKWPNDIMVNNKKIAGILIESQVSSKKRHSVIGIGINVNQEEFDVPRATSIYLETGNKIPPQMLADDLIQILNQFISLYHEKGEDFILNAYNQQLWKLKEKHTFNYSYFKREGWIKGTTIDGQLVVNFKEEKVAFSNGTVWY